MKPAPSKENTLYLPIKQVYFDEIAAGTKKAEYREIKTTTQFRYLQSEEGVLLYDKALITCLHFQGCIDDYNNGVYPFVPIRYEYLSLAVGYAKERDAMLVEVSNISFEPHRVLGGKYAFWVIVYHLGKVVELHRKTMTRIENEAQYEWAVARVEELLPLVDDNSPQDDPNFIELVLLSNLVADYSDEHFAIPTPKK